MKNIYILGTTGTIGLQTIDVIKRHQDKFKIIGLALGNSNRHLHYDILDFAKPEIVSLRDESLLLSYQKDFPDIKFVLNDEGLLELIRYPKHGMVVNAISGSAGLVPTIEAIKSGKDVALANKESIVMAGSIVMNLVKEHNVRLLPIDSEHNAIFSALVGEPKEAIKSITITASGGSFRDKSRDELKGVTVEEALNHPNWQMGPKITIDSATMMNKGLEVIEAHHLFGLPFDKIHTVIHKESIVHGMVMYQDNAVKAVLACADMRMPILYALSYPSHLESGIKEIIFSDLTLSFEKMDFERFPMLKYAYDAGKKGGLYPVVLNASNEAAVKLFLNHKITFLEIEEIVSNQLKSFKENIEEPTLEEILEMNERVQREVLTEYGFYN